MYESLVGLDKVEVLDVDGGGDGPLWVVIESRAARPVCGVCGGGVRPKGNRTVTLVDLPIFGRPVRLRWRKRRWVCPDGDCSGGSFLEQDSRIAADRALLTARAARWATLQVTDSGRAVSNIAAELGCDRKTVHREVRPVERRDR